MEVMRGGLEMRHCMYISFLPEKQRIRIASEPDGFWVEHVTVVQSAAIYLRKTDS